MKQNKWKWMGFLSAALLGTQCAVLPVSAMELPTVDAIPENIQDVILYIGEQAKSGEEGETQAGITPCGVIFSYDGLQVPTPEELGLDASTKIFCTAIGSPDTEHFYCWFKTDHPETAIEQIKQNDAVWECGTLIERIYCPIDDAGVKITLKDGYTVQDILQQNDQLYQKEDTLCTYELQPDELLIGLADAARVAGTSYFDLEAEMQNGTYEAVNTAKFVHVDLALIQRDFSVLMAKEGTEPERGDVNRDNAITLEDATAALSYYAEASVKSETLNYGLNDRMDINGDHAITMDDATALLTYYAEHAVGNEISWEEACGQ